MAIDRYRTRKIELVEKRQRRSWQHFSMTRAGRMSWANWFVLQGMDFTICSPTGDEGQQGEG